MDPFDQFDRQARGLVLGTLGLVLGLALGLVRVAFALLVGFFRLVTRSAKRGATSTSLAVRETPKAPRVKGDMPAAGGPGNPLLPIALFAVGGITLLLMFGQSLEAQEESPRASLLAGTSRAAEVEPSVSDRGSSTSEDRTPEDGRGLSEERADVRQSAGVPDVPSADDPSAAATADELPRASEALDCPGEPLLENEPYQVKLIDTVLNVRDGPSAAAAPVDSLQPIEGPLYFKGCTIDSDGMVWWLTEWDTYVAADFIELLRPLNDCSAALSPSTGRSHRVDAVLPNGPLQVRGGPGVEYDSFAELQEGQAGLRFRGCTLSSEGGAWWMLSDGGYVFSKYVSPES